MSFEIPTYMEPEVRQYATSLHITSDEAVVRLIKAGLGQAHDRPTTRSIVGAFSSPEDAAALDAALDLAMQDRERRHETSDRHA